MVGRSIENASKDTDAETRILDHAPIVSLLKFQRSTHTEPISQTVKLSIAMSAGIISTRSITNRMGEFRFANI